MINTEYLARVGASSLISELGIDIDSPLSWLNHANPNPKPPKPYYSHDIHRDLTSNDEYTDLLVDEDGNSYEPYSLAWRYLGMYIDCEDDNDDGNDDAGEQNRRRLDSDDTSSGCPRKLLWAAYRDPGYSGGSIGEYQYYNLTTGEYDSTFCKADRCVPLDCHDPNTSFDLVGVYSETDGLEDFAEQLFKHEGYCIWDYDTFSLMSSYRQSIIPYGCTQLHFPDNHGDTIYYDIQPQPKGDIAIGVYKDDKCTKQARLSIEDYIQKFYETNGDTDKGKKIARAWTKAIQRWNKHMSIYKICQPCRAYNLANGGVDTDYASADRVRQLEDNDGQGDEEQWGYDCYDNAGYTNCNQCYKFQSKTYLEPATTEDLEVASQQGTILEIRVDGKRYGRGGYFKRFPRLSKFLANVPQWAIVSMGLVGGFLGFVGCVLVWRKLANSAMLGTFLEWIRERYYRQELPNSFKEHFHIEDDKTVDLEQEEGRTPKPLSYVYE